MRLARERNEAARWWEEVEEVTGCYFRSRMPMREVRRLALLENAKLDNDLTELGDCFCHE